MRYERTASLMAKLWGEFPANDGSSWDEVVSHTLELDDQVGRQEGVVVAGDNLSLHLLARLMRFVPESAPVRQQLPPELMIRVAAEHGREALERWLAAGQDILSAATSTLAATGGGVYLHHGDEAVLSGYLNWTPEQVNFWRRIPMELDQPVPLSITQARLTWGTYSPKENVAAGDDEIELAVVPIAVDPATSSAAGALLLHWRHGPDVVIPRDIEPTLTMLADRLTESFELWRPYARPQPSF